MVTGGPAQPKVQEFPSAPTTTRPVIAPTTTGGPSSGAPELSGSGTLPAPVQASGSDFGPTADLPPIPPPPPPVSPGTSSLQKPALPSAPLPRVMGVPGAPSNQANFQQ
jgi:hypothetical protein